MHDSATFGEVYDHADKPARKPRLPKTPIGLFYHAHLEERITHWCKRCRRWHGPSCFYGVSTKP